MIDNLSQVCGTKVSVELFSLSECVGQVWHNLEGTCIDDLAIEVNDHEFSNQTLFTQGNYVEESLHSHLLRSNCPVTDQPDWASVQIVYQGPAIEREGLLRYLCRFASTKGFMSNVLSKCLPILCITVSPKSF